MVRAARSPHHRARQSALAARPQAKAAIPITNPNQVKVVPEPKDEESPNDDSASDGSDSEDSVVESLDDSEIKIAKPPGEVGRPGRGGYSLEQVLDWPPKCMKAFKVYRIC